MTNRVNDSRRVQAHIGASVVLITVVLISGIATKADELPKKFDFSHTLIATIDEQADWTTLDMGDHQKAWVASWTQVALNDEGKGFRHNTSGQCIGMGFHAGEGQIEGGGFCYGVDADGDKLFEHWEFTGEGVGTGTYSGGTGKYAGIECSHQFELIAAPTPSVEGVGQRIARE